jgi:hypothetical protein
VIGLLISLHERITRDDLSASSNEVLDYVPTTNLELLGVEYHLGRAHLMLPSMTPASSLTQHNSRSNGPSSAIARRQNVKTAIEHYLTFLKGLERLGEGMLEGETLIEYHRLLDKDVDDDDGDDDDNNDDGCKNNNKLRIGYMNNDQPPMSVNNSSSSSSNPSLMRDMKIRHYQRRKGIEKRKQQYQSQLQRRSRLGLPDDEILDGYDTENLTRAFHIETLRCYAENSLEEIAASKLELEMLQMSIRMMGCNNNSSSSCSDNGDSRNDNNDSRMAKQRTIITIATASTQQQQQQRPLQMTQIRKNPLTDELVLIPKHALGGQLVTTTTTTNGTTS